MKPIFIPYRFELNWLYYWDPDNGEQIAHSNINLQEYYAVRIRPIEHIFRLHL
jgi:hypothetical protein